MASVRLLESVCSACRFTLTCLRFQKPLSPGLLTSQKRQSSRSALPPVDKIAEEDLAEYEVSTEEFQFVERVLPPKTVPPSPHHESYPTPSGWIPPKETDRTLPYFVRRTKNHMLPIYEELRNGNSRKMVKIRHIDGDIWAFDADLRNFLLEVTDKKVIASQVHELGGYIRVKGQLANEVCQFLLNKGF